LLQHQLIHRLLHIPVRRWWWLTVVGGIAGVGAIWFTTPFTRNGVYDLLEPLLGTDLTLTVVMSFYLLGISGMQWLELRKHMQSAWLWIAANIVSPLVALSILLTFFSGISTDVLVFMMIPAVILLMGIITGITLLRLSGIEGKSKRDLAAHFERLEETKIAETQPDPNQLALQQADGQTKAN
jgi:hypothetical protein